MNILFSEIFRMSLTGSGIICMVLLARLALKKAPKIYSYLLWSVVLLRLLCPMGIPVAGLPSVPDLKITEVQLQPREELRASAPEAEQTLEEAKGQTGEAGERVRQTAPDWQSLVPWAWALGAMAVGLYGMGSYLRFRRHLVGAVRIRKNIYAVDHIGAAYVVGLLVPKIYVDSGIPEDQLPYILVHEQTHIRRGDHVTRCLAFAALCLHWFNPLVWAAFVLSGRDMEMSCDESVISRMGSQVRMSYSQSLLTLATGQHIRLGCPVAFGEGSTKGRVRNLARWKRAGRKLRLVCILTTAALLLLCACEPKAEKSDQAAAMNMEAQQREDFFSRDGSARFTWDLQSVPDLPELPILALQPHEITERDVRAAAGQFYGESPLYDLGTSGQRTYSRQELQRRLDFLRTYEDPETWQELQFSQDDGADPGRISGEIEDYEKRLPSAPEEIPCRVWDGSFETEPWRNEHHDVLRVLGYRDQIPYMASVQRDSYQGQQWNGIFFALSDGQRHDIAGYLADAVMHTGDPPDQEAAARYAAQGQALLNGLGLGQWQTAEAEIWERKGEGPAQHGVNVQAVPVLAGIPMLLWQEGDFFRRSQPEDQAPLQIPQAYLSYTPDGLLTEFSAQDFMEIRETADPHAGLLSLEELMDAAQAQLSSYGAPVLASYEWRMDTPPEDLTMEGKITEVRVGLGLQKVGEDYFAVPAVQFLGRLECSRGDSRTGDTGRDPVPFVTLNATDGSIIG